MVTDLKKILESKFARMLKLGNITFDDIPKEFQDQVKNEMHMNGFDEEIPAEG